MMERKYKILDGKIVNRKSGKEVPEDEPLFIFRAQDKKALAALVAYSLVVDKLEHRAQIQKDIEDFRAFQEKHPERMKEPDSISEF